MFYHLFLAGYYATKSTPIRIVVGLWGLSVFVLHNYYTGDLTSFITAPNPQPLIKSIYELNNRPDILVVTDSGTNGATVILVIIIFLNIPTTKIPNSESKCFIYKDGRIRISEESGWQTESFSTIWLLKIDCVRRNGQFRTGRLHFSIIRFITIIRRLLFVNYHACTRNHYLIKGKGYISSRSDEKGFRCNRKL